MAQPAGGGQPVATSTQDTQPAAPSSGPNANPLNLFPQVEIMSEILITSLNYKKYPLEKSKTQF